MQVWALRTRVHKPLWAQKRMENLKGLHINSTATTANTRCTESPTHTLLWEDLKTWVKECACGNSWNTDNYPPRFLWESEKRETQRQRRKKRTLGWSPNSGFPPHFLWPTWGIWWFHFLPITVQLPFTVSTGTRKLTVHFSWYIHCWCVNCETKNILTMKCLLRYTHT